ncbi:unnamed protein product [Echinostoma caproni]|uniref:gamma-glutamylcyclotransferase n=1 Tax=Echinostoma caproni TaxID=27848 RepID=A0A183A958_9TREM|nr:unnamed protein product [Echinostoma caproni]
MCKQKFHYFAYGSNLLKQRIQLRNPSAVFAGIGLLSGYSIKFVGHSSYWGGAVATIEPSQGDIVCGAVWILDTTDLPSLDAQEGVPKIYTPLEVNVTLSGDDVLCRTYRANTIDRGLPSPYYLDVILRGAIQCLITPNYVEKIRSIRHNEYFGGSPVYSAVLEQLDKTERDAFEIKELRALCSDAKQPKE